MMANKAMMTRHWERIAQITGHTFDVESENFLLRDLMKAPLLQYKEDIEVSHGKILMYMVKYLINDDASVGAHSSDHRPNLYKEDTRLFPRLLICLLICRQAELFLTSIPLPLCTV